MTGYKNWLIRRIGSGSLITFAPFLIAGLFSKNYLSFGIKSYKFFNRRKVVTEQSKILVSQRRSQLTSTYLERNNFASFCVLNLFPTTFPRTAESKGLPFAYFLSQSAEEIKLQYYDYPTQYLSNYLSKNDIMNLEQEMTIVEDFIRVNKVSHILWYAHKRSATKLNIEFLKKLRDKHHVKVICWLTDNWNIEYVELANLYGDLAELILVNDFNPYFELLVNENVQYRVLWQSRPKPLQRSNLQSTYLNQNFIFQGTYYLNRIPWLVLISKVLAKTGKKLQHRGNSNTLYSLSVDDYLKTYSTGQTFSFHFLERTPGIYSLTASIWDAFSQGSLVIVQTCLKQDPLENFFTPDEHYLRFETYADLKILISRILSDSNFAASIADNGFNYYSKNYNAKSYWQKILFN